MTALTNALGPLDRAGVQFVGRGPVEFGVPLVSLRKTFGASVVETAVEFVHEPGTRIVAIAVVAMLAHPYNWGSNQERLRGRLHQKIMLQPADPLTQEPSVDKPNT